MDHHDGSRARWRSSLARAERRAAEYAEKRRLLLLELDRLLHLSDDDLNAELRALAGR